MPAACIGHDGWRSRTMGEEAMMSASVIFLKLVTRAGRNGSWSLYYGIHFSGDSVSSARNIGLENG